MAIAIIQMFNICQALWKIHYFISFSENIDYQGLFTE